MDRSHPGGWESAVLARRQSPCSECKPGSAAVVDICGSRRRGLGRRQGRTPRPSRCCLRTGRSLRHAVARRGVRGSRRRGREHLRRPDCRRLAHPSSMGSPGVDKLRWLAPVRVGDRLRLRLTILDARTSESRPDRGIIRLNQELLNQRGEVVMALESSLFMKRRGSLVLRQN